MADENSIPFQDASQIEVLIAGNIADDDLMWVVRCSLKELHRLFERPVSWVAGLGSLPGWRYYGSDKPAPPPILTRDFAMLIEATKTPDPEGWVVVQGISGTNQITVLASWTSAVQSLLAMDKVAAATARVIGLDLPAARSATNEALAQTQGDPFAPFWDEVARDPHNPPSLKKKLPLNVVRTASRFYAHFEILHADETSPETAARVATFALATALDPAGYAAMLNGLDQEALFVDRGSIEKGERITIEDGGRPSVVYANIDGSKDRIGASITENDAPEDPDEPGGEFDEIACSFVEGEWMPAPVGPGSGTPNGSVLKRWGVEGGQPVLYPNG